LALFLPDDSKRTGQCSRQLGGVFYTFAIPSCSDAHLLERRQLVEPGKGLVIAASRFSIRIHRKCEVSYRIPHLIIHDNKQHRQLVQRRCVVDGNRI
jgi:hypothetical protein